MQTYREYRPTGFDLKGLALPDRQDWIVLPCGRNRDSGTLDESNFRTVLASLEGESETCEVHRFGHWACGWFEIIILAPERETDAEEIDGTLADYPVFNEHDYSELQYETAADCWARMCTSDRVYACQRFRVSPFAARRDELPEDPTGGLVDYLADGN